MKPSAKPVNANLLLTRAVDALSLLLSSRDPRAAWRDALKMLCEAAQADRIYVFENHPDPKTGDLLTSQRHEWCNQSVAPQLDNVLLQSIPYHPQLTRWYETLGRGGIIQGAIKQFPETERAMLEPQGVRSILVLPIVVRDAFWGFIGFDDCRTERIWTAEEQVILRAAAVGVGAAYVRLENEERHRLASVVFDSARDAIVVADPTGRLLAVNEGLTRLTGYDENELRGRPYWILWAKRMPRRDLQDIAAALTSGNAWTGEFTARRKDGEYRTAMLKITAVRDGHGELTHMVGIATDVTQQVEAERRAERLAFYDPVTDLPNRALLAQQAELALVLATRRKQRAALILLDLDRFREINDSLGHSAGDALLRQVAVRLAENVGPEDSVCRLGGDEFAVLLPDTDEDRALRVADKILHMFAEAFPLSGHSLRLTGSVGIALFPNDGANFTDLLKNADSALNRAKTEGKNTRVFYDRAMNDATFERLVLEAELREALRTPQLLVYFQPKVTMATRGLSGAEALVRWQHPKRGLLAPGHFIPVAESSDLIVALGDRVLSEVCRQLADWRAAGHPPVTVSVNLAARHFRRPGLADRVAGILQAYGLPSELLEIELTESTLLDERDDTLANLLDLRHLGVRLALDDFGTGYSSLSYLKRLPLNALKIDRSFVRDLVTDLDDRKLAGTVIALGKHLDLEVVAEGVETEEQLRVLVEEGCVFGQGYLFGRPCPASEFVAQWLAPRRCTNDAQIRGSGCSRSRPRTEAGRWGWSQ